jgi:hypothetical protein
LSFGKVVHTYVEATVLEGRRKYMKFLKISSQQSLASVGKRPSSNSLIHQGRLHMLTLTLLAFSAPHTVSLHHLAIFSIFFSICHVVPFILPLLFRFLPTIIHSCRFVVNFFVFVTFYSYFIN